MPTCNLTSTDVSLHTLKGYVFITQILRWFEVLLGIKKHVILGDNSNHVILAGGASFQHQKSKVKKTKAKYQQITSCSGSPHNADPSPNPSGTSHEHCPALDNTFGTEHQIIGK